MDEVQNSDLTSNVVEIAEVVSVIKLNTNDGDDSGKQKEFEDIKSTFLWKKKGAIESAYRNDVSTAPEELSSSHETNTSAASEPIFLSAQGNISSSATEYHVLLSADKCVFDRLVVKKSSSTDVPVDVGYETGKKEEVSKVGNIVYVLEEVRKEVFCSEELGNDSTVVDTSVEPSEDEEQKRKFSNNSRPDIALPMKSADPVEKSISSSLFRGKLLKVKNDKIMELCSEACKNISNLKLSAWQPIAKMLKDGEDEENVLKAFIETLSRKEPTDRVSKINDTADLDNNSQAVKAILELGRSEEIPLERAKNIAETTLDSVNRILAMQVDEIVEATCTGRMMRWPDSSIEKSVTVEMQDMIRMFLKTNNTEVPLKRRPKIVPKRLPNKFNSSALRNRTNSTTTISKSVKKTGKVLVKENKISTALKGVFSNDLNGEKDLKKKPDKTLKGEERKTDENFHTYSWLPGDEQDIKQHHLVTAVHPTTYSCGYCSKQFPSLRALGYHAGCSYIDRKLARPVQVYFCRSCFSFASTLRNLGGHSCKGNKKVCDDEESLLDWDDLMDEDKPSEVTVKRGSLPDAVSDENSGSDEEPMDFDNDDQDNDSDYKPEEEEEEGGGGDLKAFNRFAEKEPKSVTRSIVLRKKSTDSLIPKRKKAPARLLQKSCAICDMTFESGIIYRTHARTVHGLIKACRKCNIEFRSKAEHDEHMKTEHADPLAIVCSVCQASFIVRHTFFKHLSQHSGIILCNECGEKLEGGTAYAEHLKTIHADVVRPNLKRCNRCCLDFDSKRDRDKHYWTVHERPKVKEEFPEPMPCHICGKIYRKCKYMEIHLRRHAAGWKPRVCPKCGIQRWSREAYKKHLRQHEGELFYRCRRCKTSYASRADLVLHQVEKHERKPVTTLKAKVSAGVKCEHCGEIFRDTRLVSKHHAQMHVAERPFCCHICGIRYPKKTALNHHLNRHKEGGPFPCLYCGTEYPTRLARWDHQKTAHDEQIRTCTVCGRLVPTRKGLKIHVKSHFMVKKGFVNEETKIMMKNVLSDLSFYT